MNMTTQTGLPDLITPIYEAKKNRIKNYPCYVNRASSAGHPCEKFLVYSRTKWQEKLLHDVGLQFIFEAGNVIEERAFNYLKEGGFTVIEQQRPFQWKKFELSGHLDCKILVDNIAYPVEIKGINQFDFDKLNAVEDFLESKKVWIKGYPSQLTLYMLMSNIEYGCFFIINKANFRPKQIWISLDYTFAEDILLKLERVNKHVKESTVPEGINQPDICQYCGFLHICLPDMVGKEIEIIDEVSIEQAIKRCEELKPLVSEYNKLDKQWKKALEEKEKVMIGDYIIIGKWIERKGYTVDDSKYWQSKILIKPKGKLITEE